MTSEEKGYIENAYQKASDRKLRKDALERWEKQPVIFHKQNRMIGDMIEAQYKMSKKQRAVLVDFIVDHWQKAI